MLSFGVVRKFLAVSLSVLLAQTAVWPCTIVSGVAANGVVWAGNNEDFIFDFETYLNVLPPDRGKFGAMFFTYGGPANFPQGGINEKGLFFDLNAIPKVQREGYRDYGKRKAFPGGDIALLLHMLQTSATVNDALALLEQFRFDDLFEEQLHLADRGGALAVVTAQGVVRPQQRNFPQISIWLRNLMRPKGKRAGDSPSQTAFWDRRASASNPFGARWMQRNNHGTQYDLWQHHEFDHRGNVPVLRR